MERQRRLDGEIAEAIEQRAQRANAAVAWNLQGERVLVADDIAKPAGGGFESGGIGELRAGHVRRARAA